MNFLDGVMTGKDFCDNLGIIPNLVKTIINLIKWGIPLILVIYGMLDLGKAVMAGKEDEMKKFQGALIKRVIYAVVVFLVVTIVQFVMVMIGEDNSWANCFISGSTEVGDGTNASGER